VGFSKNNRRDEILAILRRKEQRESGGKETGFTLRDGPVDLENVERYQKRNNIFDVDKRPVFGPLEYYHKDLVSRTPPQLPKAISVPQLWRIPEKFLFDLDICINNLFESGAWKFQGNELLIQSSEFQYFELNSLHAFFGALDTCCTDFVAGKPGTAGFYWRSACEENERLVQGSYRDTVPNMIQQLNDLNNQG
jgi:hypothetical protein